MPISGAPQRSRREQAEASAVGNCGILPNRGLRMIARARHLRDMAAECRSVAGLAKDPQVWAQLMDIADHLEHLARSHESLEARAEAESHHAAWPGLIKEISEPTHKSLKEVYAYWLTKRGPRIAPPISALRSDELALFLPDMTLLEAVGDPPRFRYRLHGTRVAEAYGENLIGRFLDEIDLGSGRAGIIGLCTNVVTECRPQVARVRYTKQRDGRLLEYERILLPLSDDGKAVNMLLCVFAFEKEFHGVT